MLFEQGYFFQYHDWQSFSTVYVLEEGTAAPTPTRKQTFTEHGLAESQEERHYFDWLSGWGKDKANHHLLKRLRQVSEPDIEAFVQRFQHVAQSEQEKFGIPASIILAHALLQSNAGTLPVASVGYNYFALPCTSDWEDQTQDGSSSECLRKYNNAWLSFRDHSLFLTTGSHLFTRLKQ
ncbi:MAG: glucosaminidase domain-containing protein [Saprospiraceae bacterium]